MSRPEPTVQDRLRLRVAEALGKDVGRGIVRLDPADMERLGAQIGDVLELTGKRTTAGKAMPAFFAERGKARVQVDGLLRQNAGVALDEHLELRRIEARPADEVTIAPVTITPRERDLKYIGRLLDGLVVSTGDRIRATLFGSRAADFVVEGSVPPGPVVIIPTTHLNVAKSPPRKGDRPVVSKGASSYEDLGGLGPQIRRIREMIELPLRFPEVFERLGIEPPQGVLLYGPPGCGKTLIARVIAQETEANFFQVSGPEVIHKFYGESEAHLRKIFEEAGRKGPSIIFLDEIDAIAPQRDKVVGDVEKRVVATLLALMDGLNQRGKVIVIAATNRPNALDPALRRPGRFDREIAIPIPNQEGRLQILEIHSRGMPLAGDVDLSRLAAITHGYVGADLDALCREAAMCRLRQIFGDIDFSARQIPYEKLAELEVSMEDFMEAFREVEPSAIREIFIEVPDVRWEDVGGLGEVKQRLREAVEWPLLHAGLFKEASVTPPRGILLYGPPGCGKTLLARAAATECQVNFISVKGPSLLSKYVGESEQGVREIFHKARQAAPCIIFFDEVDALVPTRGADGGGDARVAERVLSQFLTEMDGIEELKGVLVLGATNRMDMLDPAILRPGRFDELIQLTLPDSAGREEILRVQLRGKPMAADVDMAALAAATDNFSGAELAGVCRRAAMAAVREAITGGGEGGLVVSQAQLLAAVRELGQEG